MVCTIGAPIGAPNTTILTNPPDPSNSRTASFTFTGTDDTTALVDLAFECRLDSTNELAWVECENPQVYTNLAPGTHTFEVRAVDAGELADPTPASYTWTYIPPPSGVAPDTIIEIAPVSGAPLFEAFFKFSSNEPDTTFQCSLDGAPFTACGNEPEMIAANWYSILYEFEEFQVGQHTFQVRAIDSEGLVDPTPATHTWSILGVFVTVTNGPAYIAPEEIGEPAEGGETTDTTATFEFEANVVDTTFLCSLDMGPFVACTSPTTYMGLVPGEHLLRIIGQDPEGELPEMEPTEYSWTVVATLDTTPPDTSITSGGQNATGAMVFTFTGVDNVTSPEGLTFECSLDDPTTGAFTECTNPWTLPNPEFPAPLTVGPHIFYVRAVDFEGNFDLSPASFAFNYTGDAIAPITTILTGPPAETGSTEAIFTFTVNDPFATFECSLDGVEFVACTSPFEASVEPGVYEFQVRAIDLALNTGPAATYGWTVLGPPDTTITSGPPLMTADTTATFEFVADQAGSTFTCSLNGSAFAACTSPLTLTGVGNGTWTFAVLATNSYGLVEEEAALYTWEVTAGEDTTPPDTTIDSGPVLLDAPATANFTFSSNELGSAFECQLDGLGYSSCDSPVEYTELVGGPHVFEVRAIDLAGNIDPTPAVYNWFVLAPPSTTVLTGPEDGTLSTEATFTFISSVPGADFYCALDVPPFVPCTSPVTYTGLTPGSHIFVVNSEALGFIDSEGDEWDWTIGTATALQTFLTNGPPSTTTSTDATFEFSANLDSSTFACSLDGAAPAACTSPVSFTGLETGSHTFTVVATGPLGEIDPTPALYTWTILGADTTPPDTTITAAPPATTVSSEATFTFVASEPFSTFECALDGEVFEACTSPLVLDGLEIAGHTLAVRAIDAAGNADPSPATYNWTVEADVTAPETTITNGPSGANANTDVLFEFTGADDGTPVLELEFECALDGEPFAGCSSPYEVADLELGEHTFAVRAIDQAGNVDATPASRTWTVVDAIAPETTIDTGPADPTELTTATFTFSSDDPTATFACSLDGADFFTCTSPHAETGLGIGLHTFAVRAVDPSDNTDLTPDLYEWTVIDLTPPDTVITDAPEDPTELTTAVFVFASAPPGVVDFECSLNGEPFVECESPHLIEDLPLATHEFQVRAIDLAGNVDATPALHTWTIQDTIAPDTFIESGPSEETTSTSATFEFSATEEHVTFECLLDDALDYVTCPSPHEITGLGVGAHELRVRARDAAGNADLTPAEYFWIVTAGSDITPPDTTIASGPAGGDGGTTLLRNATFTFSSDDPLASFECALDSETSFSSCVSPEVITDLEPGIHTFRVRASDPASNIDPTPALYTWTVLPPPDTFIDAAPPAQTENTDATFAFSSDTPGVTFECSLNETLFAPCTSPLSYTGLTLGEYEFVVQAKDSAGNLDPTPATHSWEIGDMTPPIVTILSGPPATTTATSATFTFAMDNPAATVLCSLDGAAPTLCLSPQIFNGLTLDEHTLELYATTPTLIVEPIAVGYSWTVVANTPAGTNVLVELTMPVSGIEPANVTFTQVDTEGTTTVEVLTSPPPLPDGYLNLGSLYYDVETTALFSGNVTVCLGYHPSDFADPGSLQLLHFVNGVWNDATTTNDTLTGLICGVVTSLSPFAVAAPVASLSTSTATATVMPTATATPVAPTATATLTATATETAIPPTATATETPVPPTATATTAEPPTATATATLEPPTATATATPDTTAPETMIDSGPAATTFDTTATFSFSANEPGATFACALDGGAFAPCTSPATYPGLSVGNHTFQVQASDAAGNVDATPASYAWTIIVPDTTTPETILDSVPPVNTQLTTADFVFSANEEPVSFACALDGGAFAPCTSPHQVTGLAVGSHTFTVRATDTAGNTDPTPATFTWTIQAPMTCVVETEVYGVTADAWLEQNSPSSNKGGDSILKVKSQGPTDNFRALVQFNLPGTLPNGCVILSATLRLYSPSWTDDRTLEALRVNSNWAENSVTWANQPATAGAAATTTSAQGYREWDVTAQVQEMFTAGASYGFLIRDAAENGGGSEQQFHSREKGETMPALVVRYTPAMVTDTIAPATSLDAWPASSTYDTSANFSFSANEAGATFECRLDGGSYSECISPKQYNELSVGAHTFAVRAVDPIGNYDDTPSTYNWTVTTDTTPPIVTINSGPAALTSETTASFTFAANEVGATFACALNGAAFAPCTSPVGYSGLAVSSHIFQVHASDTTGNTSAPVSYNWTVGTPPDTTAPVVTISAGPSPITVDTSASFSFTADERAPSAPPTFECSLDGAALASCTSPVTINNLTLGAHSFAVQATDSAGNIGAPATHTWTVTEPPDTTQPDTMLTDMPANPSASAAASFSFTGSDNRSDATTLTFECALDGGTAVICTSPMAYGGLSDGAHTFTVVAVDEAGNRDAEPASHTWTVALPPAPPTPPETVIDSGPTASTTAMSATFSFSANEAGVTFECSWDNGGFTPCTTPATQSGLALGEHSFSVRAVSSANGSDPSPASHIWMIVEPPDTTAPETTVTSQPAQPTSEMAASFSFSASDNMTPPGELTFECRLDTGVFAACTSPASYNNLSVGSHTFTVRAADAAGNVDATPATITWTISAPPDTTAPQTTITAGPAANTAELGAAFSFTADETGATFQCALDGAAFAACTSPKSYSGLSVGSHTFQVRATDTAGNVDQTPASQTWSITAPTSCTAAPLTLNASADAWIDQNSPSNNFGADSILKVQAKSSNNFRALVRFALPASLPPGCMVQSATLKLYAASWKTGRTLQTLRVAATWAENAVSWNNQPATIGAATTTNSGSNWRQWNVTSQVQAMFDTSANHGFLIRDATESGGGNEQQFHGREKNDKIPQLVLTFATGSNSAGQSSGQMAASTAQEQDDAEAVTLSEAAFLPIIAVTQTIQRMDTAPVAPPVEESLPDKAERLTEEAVQVTFLPLIQQ